MKSFLELWHLLLLILAGCINHRQQGAVEYLRTENEILKEKLGKKRLPRPLVSRSSMASSSAFTPIGDRANRETLDIFERAFQGRPDSKELRWRIEHAQHLNATDIPRFSRLGIIASMQGIHCTSDAPLCDRPVG